MDPHSDLVALAAALEPTVGAYLLGAIASVGYVCLYLKAGPTHLLRLGYRVSPLYSRGCTFRNILGIQSSISYWCEPLTDALPSLNLLTCVQVAFIW